MPTCLNVLFYSPPSSPSPSIMCTTVWEHLLLQKSYKNQFVHLFFKSKIQSFKLVLFWLFDHKSTDLCNKILMIYCEPWTPFKYYKQLLICFLFLAWTNMKITAELQSRERADKMAFMKAGRDPIIKTYKYDPTQIRRQSSSAIEAKKKM